MKKVILLGLLLVSFVGYSQVKIVEVKNDNGAEVIDREESTDPNRIYVVVETKPEYPGGITAFREFIAKNYKNPKTTRDVKGTLIVEFVVDADGSMSDIRVLRDLGFGTGFEAVRVLKLAEKWKPGVQNGKAVRVRYTLPLKIDIEVKKK